MLASFRVPLIPSLGRNGNQAKADIEPAAKRILEIRSFVDGDKVTIAIMDFGKGLVPVEIEQAFEPFYNSKDSGLGPGLSIGKAIITEHGGELRVSSDPARGAAFTVLLPARDAS